MGPSYKVHNCLEGGIIFSDHGSLTSIWQTKAMLCQAIKKVISLGAHSPIQSHQIVISYKQEAAGDVSVEWKEFWQIIIFDEMNTLIILRWRDALEMALWEINSYI